MLIWGNFAFANLPPNAGTDVRQEVLSRMAYLNSNYTNVDVSVVGDLLQPGVAGEARYELQVLESYLRNEVQLAPHTLQILACVRPVCGGTGEGGH
jgi:hypothetical protein